MALDLRFGRIHVKLDLMENTSPLLFDNIDEKYFLAVEGRAVGPLTSQEIYQRLQTGEINLLNFFWSEGWSDWKRICDARDFAVLVPKKPSATALGQLREKLGAKKRAATQKQDAPPSPEARTYYLYFNSSQYGPFSKNELFHILESHKLSRNAYAWTPGWANWRRLSEIEEFKDLLPPSEPPALPASPKQTKKERTQTRSRAAGRTSGSDKIERTKTSAVAKDFDDRTIGVKVSDAAGVDASDKRGGPRRPLVARLFLHNDKDVIIAVCRDISVGGMQVLTDRVPGAVGSVIKLNVSPGDPAKVKGFVAEGEIVRVLEDGRGFSFRFRKISDEARRTIEKYIRAEE